MSTHLKASENCEILGSPIIAFKFHETQFLLNSHKVRAKALRLSHFAYLWIQVYCLSPEIKTHIKVEALIVNQID
jgi:hypothetical protein